MIEMIIKRLFASIWILLAAISFVFVISNGIGDPAAATLGTRAGPEQLEAFRSRHGLDRPLIDQYFSYLGNALTGDLGRSYRDDQPVMETILTRLPRTALLMGMALLFQVLIGLVFGTIAALRKNTAIDTGIMASAFVGISVPVYLSGALFLNIFAFRFGWFPIGGYGDGWLAHLYHGLLPAFTIAIIGGATYARIMRSEMLDTLSADYIRTARAKGLSKTRVVVRHAVRNAMLPIVTLIGLSFPSLVSGAILTEYVYNWPGMGRLTIESITALDVPTIMGLVIITAAAVQLGNLIADVALALLDPRVRMNKD